MSQAQRHSSSQLPEFDLVVCDEAHRTTGVAEDANMRSEFLKVHDNEWVKTKKRLYMTATPRIYTDESQRKAQENEYLLASMDDVSTYGFEFHRLGFGEAVERDLLADYKVLILTVSESMLQHSLNLDSAQNRDVSLDDAVKIIGCWNGLAKRDDPGKKSNEFADDPEPMRRAVAFSRSIKDSKHIRNYFPQVTNQFIDVIGEPFATRVEVEHVDGKDSVLRRSQMLDWLKQGAPEDHNVCRILSNARCLSEGVDVPALDAVLFLNPRDSVVDVVQSVGRVMRKSEGKNFGYIILPIAIPAGQSPEEALNDNQNYKVVWQVLQALRAHDDRFNAMVNKLGLNKRSDETIRIIGVGGKRTSGDGDNNETSANAEPSQIALDFAFFEQWREAIYARIVDKVGDRRYWDSWAKDIADIADTHIKRMQKLLEERDSEPSRAFDRFLDRLHEEINPAVSRDDAIEMLAQHLITRPVFSALFASESFALQNPVSQAMQQMLDSLGEQQLAEERTTLERFYRSVHQRAANIDNAEGRQKVVIELYDKFFRNAFPKMAERLGIVYTPIEVVDYLLHSADFVLRQHFGKGLTAEGVHVLDPFTGTGTFITRLLQSGLIREKDAARKFENELHANEIVLLAYYIAAVNIEVVYQEAFGGEYRPFEGIVWTDTFQMTENEQVQETDEGAQFRIMEFNGSENSERAIRQMRTPIRVIVGNPPYSAGQNSANDNNQNLRYEHLDRKIAVTYAARSTGQNLNSLYDSYIRAIKWASDRIDNNGVIAFVTNAGFIDGNAMDGVRASLTEEFSSAWIFNLRGNQRTAGEMSRREGGKIFGSGSRAPIALTLLVKDTAHEGSCDLHYHDIGDYLNRDEKLAIIRDVRSVENVQWQRVAPNAQHDWINQRDPAFGGFIAMRSGKEDQPSVFSNSSPGLKTNRDAWTYNSSKEELYRNHTVLLDAYQQSLHSLPDGRHNERTLAGLAVSNAQRIKWSSGLYASLARRTDLAAIESEVRISTYRPFFKQHLMLHRGTAERPGRVKNLFPNRDHSNLIVYVSGAGAAGVSTPLMVDTIPNLHLVDSGQAFPLYWYQSNNEKGGTANQPSLIPESDGGVVRHDGITDLMVGQYRRVYNNPSVTKEDVFYYVYGVLHSTEYRERFGADLKKNATAHSVY